MTFYVGDRGDWGFEVDNFEDAVVIGLDEYSGQFLIGDGRAGQLDNMHMDVETIAYSVGERYEGDLRFEGKPVDILRIIDDTKVPAGWKVGSPRRMYQGSGLARLALEPVNDPSVADVGIPMERTKVLGCTYPRVLTTLPYFGDTSWKNDMTDSVVFAIHGRPFKIYIQPARLFARTEDNMPRYTVFELGSEAGQDLQDALDSADMSSGETFETDSTLDLITWLDEQGAFTPENATSARARMLELDAGPRVKAGARESDPHARAKMLELDLDDLKFNPRSRRARANPSDNLRSAAAQAAKEKFEEFHRKKPTKIFTRATSPIPAKVRELGKAMFVLYRSSKNDPDTGRPVPKPIDYIHEHDAGVHCYSPARGGTVAVPAFIRDAEALVLLGTCLGFAFKDGGKTREAESIKPFPELYATPCGKALLVIQDKTDVLAIVWGGALGVESRGIVG